ncbi:unnamed protein product [Vicia faba]|uniref:RRM domain-containing protein n=1 Tax=Vicia faba TaxID=3906 RepID=A0AAV1A0L7_VICFA|nr:unnamed protein product [Vicia faba]
MTLCLTLMQAKVVESDNICQENKMLKKKVESQPFNTRDVERMKRELQAAEKDAGEAELARNDWEEKCWELDRTLPNNIRDLEPITRDCNQALKRLKIGNDIQYVLNPKGTTPAEIMGICCCRTVNQNYANILLMLLRLRQACDHPLLVKEYNSDPVGKDSVEMAKRLPKEMLINLFNSLETTAAICFVCNVTSSDIDHFAESIDNVGLHDLFQEYGNILSSKIVISEDGKSKGFGYIQFGSEESANDAIQKMNGSTVRDKQIYVGKFIRKSERSLPEPDAKYTNLYVKNLDPDITEALLKEKFSSFGKILSLAIVKDEKGLSKGFGFMNYENPDDARRATEAMNGSQFGSKNLYVARAQKKVEREKILHQWFAERCMEKNLKYKGSNIYVKNIDDSVSDEELKSQFSACGTITYAKVMRDDKGKSKGFGFVCFSTLDEAVKAVNSFHGRMFHGKPLYVAFAQRKDVRQSLLQLQHSHWCCLSSP